MTTGLVRKVSEQVEAIKTKISGLGGNLAELQKPRRPSTALPNEALGMVGLQIAEICMDGQKCAWMLAEILVLLLLRSMTTMPIARQCMRMHPLHRQRRLYRKRLRQRISAARHC